MNLSACDINNPIYKKPSLPVWYNRDEMTDYILDEDQDSHVIKIEYETEDCGNFLKVINLKVTTKCKSQFLQEDVIEMIHQRERQRIELECEIELNQK